MAEIRTRCSLLTVVVVLAVLAAGRSADAQFTPGMKNVSTISETAITTQKMLSAMMGGFNDPLDYVGSFSDSGWSLSLVGDYGGMPVDLSFTGLFDPVLNTGSFNATGTVGAYAWESSGSWAFTDVDQTYSLMNWDSVATISGPGVTKTRDNDTSEKRNRITEDDNYIYVDDDATVYETEKGVRTGNSWEQRSRMKIPKKKPQIATVAVALGSSSLNGTASFDDCTFSGQVVPEPSGLVALACGIPFLACLVRTKRQ